VRELSIRQLSVKLQEHDLALAERQPAQRFANDQEPLEPLERLCRLPVVSAPIVPVELVLRMPPAPPELIERGVPRDREKQRPRRSAPRIDPLPRAVEAFERKSGDFLRGGAVAKERERIAVDVARRLPEERLEGRGVERRRDEAAPVHAVLPGGPKCIHHRLIYVAGERLVTAFVVRAGLRDSQTVMTVRVLRVFTDASGEAGNPLGVVADAAGTSSPDRQRIAASLGYSETVFVDGVASVQVFTPSVELPFAGHPLVGAAWLLRRQVLHSAAGDVRCRACQAGASIVGRSAWAPSFERRQFATAAEVEALPPPAERNLQAWAWADEHKGTIRARVFAPEVGVAEDPATGSAAIALCAMLGRAITIVQGPGCEIFARPLRGDLVELAGRVADDGERVVA
jgi:predicted PhzF superfamily epimerase YddE/YHI9